MVAGTFVGLATVDLVYRVDALPGSNLKVVARSQDVFVGGPAANAAITFSHLGGEATLATVVGRHALAGLILDELRRRKVALEDLNLNLTGVPAISAILVTDDGGRSVVSANAARIPADARAVEVSTPSESSILLVDGHYMGACQKSAKAARARGVRVIFDGGSWKAGTEELLSTVDFAVCSADFRPPGCADVAQTLAYLGARGIRNMAITRGGEPIRFVAEGEIGDIAVRKIDAVDTMGAGDVLHGALCHALGSGKAFREALEHAARIATFSCEFFGPRAWMNDPGASLRNPTR